MLSNAKQIIYSFYKCQSNLKYNKKYRFSIELLLKTHKHYLIINEVKSGEDSDHPVPSPH